MDDVAIDKKTLAVKQESFSAWAKWLHKIPVHNYASDTKAIEVVRKK